MFPLSEEVFAEGLKPGAEATVSFEEKDGRIVAADIKAADRTERPVAARGPPLVSSAKEKPRRGSGGASGRLRCQSLL